MLKNITGALSSVGDAVTEPFKKKKKKDKVESDVLAMVRKEDGLKRNIVDENGINVDMGETVQPEEGVNWQGALGEAVKFLAANNKEQPKPVAGAFKGSVNFDAGSLYGALQQRATQFQPYMNVMR